MKYCGRSFKSSTDSPFKLSTTPGRSGSLRIDLSSRPVQEREAEVERLLIEEPRRPYILSAEPGIRATLIRLAPEDHVLIVMLHHIVCDGWSLGILYRELGEIYRALYRHQPHHLLPPPLQYGDYATWQQQKVVAKRVREGSGLLERVSTGDTRLLRVTDRRSAAEDIYLRRREANLPPRARGLGTDSPIQPERRGQSLHDIDGCLQDTPLSLYGPR